MSIARIRELQVKSRHHGLDEEEEVELDRLGDQNRQAQLAAYPHPTCCEAAQRYRAVYFSVPDYESGRPTEGFWYPVCIDPNDDPNTRDSAWYKARPEASFCVFCGAALPKMRLKSPPPEPLCKATDGGYYCDTCHERGNCCICLPPSAAFEPVP